MATTDNGPQGFHTGRVGNIVYYVLNGKNVSRRIGKSTKPPTESQLRSRKVTSISSRFLKQFLDFVNTGFNIEAIQAMDNAFNIAMSYNKKNLIVGDYPDLQIAYDKLLLSKGTLKAPQHWGVTPIEAGVQYSWTTDPKMPWLESIEQVMMLVYFPEQGTVCYTLFGSNRSAGTATLEIPLSLQGAYMETYLSFIAADRTQVSDSIYTGSFNNPQAQAPGTFKLLK